LLKIEIRVGESIKIGDALVTLESKSGQIARLAIDASKDVPVHKVQSSTMAQIAKSGIGAFGGG